MARPKMPTKSISKWGIWKRQQRDASANGKTCAKCKKRPAAIKHHVGSWQKNPDGKTVAWCRECHAAYHNALRKKGK